MSLIDRRKICNFCKREVGIHGWAHGVTGMLAAHNCPHKKRCLGNDPGKPIGPKCDECRGDKRWGFRRESL